MEVRIWPRRPDERGGYVMMPMKKNVPQGRPGWELIQCPECGRDCWKRPVQDLVKESGVTALCTECALRKGLVGRQ